MIELNKIYNEDCSGDIKDKTPEQKIDKEIIHKDKFTEVILFHL